MNKLRPSLLITTLLLTLGLAGSAQAAVQHLNLPVCSLAVYPYNPAKAEIYNNAALPFVNFLSESICKSRTPYGSTYNQPPTKAQNPVKNVADIEDKNVPYAIHTHSYINNALEDSYYYRSYIDKFEIQLETDALNNTEKLQVQCQTPAPGSFSGSAADLSDCNGSVSDIDFYGGVSVNYNSSTGVVTWEFGTVQKNLRPNMWGNNDSNPGDSDNFNEALTSFYGTSANLADFNSVYRKFSPSVQLKTKNNATDIWSGTTTSRVLIRNYAILKSSWAALGSGAPKFATLCTTLGDYTKWCPVDTPSGQGYATVQLGSSGQQQWFWFPIGSVVSVWSKPSTPPPVDLACADLQWDGKFQKPNSIGVLSPDNVNPNALLPNQAALMKFKTIYQSGSGIKRPLEYDWVSFSGEQNRPVWFKNDDLLFIMPMIIIPIGPIVKLPSSMLQVAHAALPPSGDVSVIDSSSLNSTSVAEAALNAILKLGSFKDEYASVLKSNPLIDDDNQAYFTGGSEGVILGVQAFYTDGKNINGQGAMVSTPTGIKQKAEGCHLELKILPAPAICIKLDIDPSTIKPNTPVTFTVTPHFDPSDQTIPLNYYWNADQSSSGLPSSGGKFGIDPSIIVDPGIYQVIPGGSSSSGKPSWEAIGANDLITTGTSIKDLFDPCKYGGCDTIPVDKFINPGGPVEQGLGNINLDIGGQFGGANIFAADKIAALPGPLDASSSMISPSAASIGAIAIPSSLLTGNDQIDKDGATAKEAAYGGFKDVQGGPNTPTNPFLETVDNKTFYTGGPAGTLITVQAQGKDGTIYPLCKNQLIIPPLPPEEKCLQLKVKFMNGSTEVPAGSLVAGTTYTIVVDKANSKKTDGTFITEYNIRLNNADGPGAYGTLTADPTNAPSCSAVTGAAGTIGTDSTSVDCKYIWTPKAKDHIKIEADPTNGVAACTIEQTIPEVPLVPICKSLNLVTSPLLSGTTIAAGQTVGFTTDPRDTNNLPRNPVVYSETGGGHFVADSANAVSCTAVPADSNSTVTFEAPNTCKYSYVAPSAPNGTESVIIKVKQDDGVSDCIKTFNLPITPPPSEKCLSLNFKVNGSYTLNPLINAGSSYALQGDPITTLGNPIQFIEWTENGIGKLVGDAGNPGICPAIIDNGVVTTPAFCRYIYSSPTTAGSSDGFSARAVPDDGVAACKVTSQLFTPPKVNPYCLYLDLDTSGTFNPLGSNNMNATVVMSDGSHYNDNVRFASTDGSGNTTGGFGSTSGSGTGNFKTQVDLTNNTHNVNFSTGSATTGLNVFLADTTIVQTAACQRKLSPQVKPPEECTEPPTIVRTGNTFTAEGGDSSSYCWSISGPGNPLFNNGQKTATGDSVALDSTYTEFDLEVHDCNPEFSNICSDEYSIEGTPHIEKRISKAVPVSYGTKINYSTKGADINEAVKYQLTYTPADYAGGNLTASIYDPAFTGTINGSKTKVDTVTGATSEVKGGNVTIDLNSITVSSASKTYPKCPASFTPLDSCYELNSSSPFTGFGTITIHGIQSAEMITIKYNGTLHSSITTAECQNGTACNEKVINQSFVSDMKYCVAEVQPDGTTIYPCTNVAKTPVCKDVQYIDGSGKVVVVKPCTSGSQYMIFSNSTSAELVCQYFLTRASGDIFLEDELKYGLDISKCYPFKNISSTVAKPAESIPEKLEKTGGNAPGEVVTISHEICSAGQNNFNNTNLTPSQIQSLSELYGSGISNLSSQICEVGLVPGLVWSKDQINATISQNIGKLTRWDDGLNPGNIISSIGDITAEGNNVYYYRGTSENDQVTIEALGIPKNSGSLTIIIDNADLLIKGNIEYANLGEEPKTADEIASLGVIVIDGNVSVDKNVDKLAGAYFVQRTDSSNYAVGNVFAANNEDSDKTLTVNGSIYGNIGPLFEHRTATGDVGTEGGSITIRYDQRIIQNPPEGLSELIGDFSQSQIAQ